MNGLFSSKKDLIEFLWSDQVQIYSVNQQVTTSEGKIECTMQICYRPTGLPYRQLPKQSAEEIVEQFTKDKPQ